MTDTLTLDSRKRCNVRRANSEGQPIGRIALMFRVCYSASRNLPDEFRIGRLVTNVGLSMQSGDLLCDMFRQLLERGRTLGKFGAPLQRTQR